jgi:hypothetical protein
VCGWSYGILVHFGYRAGRLCTWTQRPCTQADAQPYLAATPSQWLQFAERNALFAAQAMRSAIASEVAELAPAAGDGTDVSYQGASDGDVGRQRPTYRSASSGRVSAAPSTSAL